MTQDATKVSRKVSHPQPPVDFATVDGLYQQGHTYRKIADLLQTNYAKVYRAHHAVSMNGDVPALTPPAHSDASHRISALESSVSYQTIDSALMHALVGRLEVVEAFVLAQQQRRDASHRIIASAHSDASQRIDPPVWVNRGTHIAADMVVAIKIYAHEHRLEIREVLDLALRRFFAGEGER